MTPTILSTPTTQPPANPVAAKPRRTKLGPKESISPLASPGNLVAIIDLLP
ncbi:MAG TPA: hypothetical protein VG122_04045 [Gemmata sp.]|jgi:hypothetical protein|nr:hypothetical protein [Gemmata sp.]